MKSKVWYLVWLLIGAMEVGRAGAATATVVFTETRGATAAKPWSGSGGNTAWTVAFNGGNPFEQALNANYGSGNPCGLTFKGGTANLADSMITTTAGINAQGTSGTLTQRGGGLHQPIERTNRLESCVSGLFLRLTAGRVGQQSDPALPVLRRLSDQPNDAR